MTNYEEGQRKNIGIFWRYQLALVGGFLAMSVHVFLTASRGAWFTLPHIGRAISAGLMFGHVVALMILLARDVPLFLRDKWHVWNIWLLSIIGGIGLGILAWWIHLSFTLYQTNPNWIVLLFGGIGLSVGFIIAPIIRPNNRYLRFLLLIVITTIVSYLPVYLSYQSYLATFTTASPLQALLYFQVDNPVHVWLIGVPFALTITLFGQLPVLFDTNSSHHVEP